MDGKKFAATVLLFLTLPAAAVAEDFKPYPGATQYTPPDSEETRAFMSAVRPGTTITAYLTGDSFEKVVVFYAGLAREYANPAKHPTARLPDGRQIRKTFFILDGAADLRSSRSWVSVQHPFIGSVSHEAGPPEYNDVRDVTEIVLTQKKQAEGAK